MMVRPVSDELVLQSQFSPGVIESFEEVIRIVISPHHFYAATMMLKPAVFSRSKLLDPNKGESLNRRHYCTFELLDMKSNLLAGRSTQSEVAGFALANCGDIREIKDNKGLQAFSILDLAEKDDRSHACIFFTEKLPKPKQIEIRSFLVGLFSKHLAETGELMDLESLFSS